MVSLPRALFALYALLAACDREVLLPADLRWDDPPPLQQTDRARLAITNNGDDTISLLALDEPGPRLLQHLRVGKNPFELEGPHHLAASPDGRFLYYNLSNYVAGSGSGPHGSHGSGSVPGFLIKLDARTGRPLGEALVDRSPGDLILSADGKLAFVSHYDVARLVEQLTRGAPVEQGFSTVAIVDTERMRVLSQVPVCPTAHGQGLSPDGRLLYVTCSLSDQIAALDVSDPTQPRVVAKVPLGPRVGTPDRPAYLPYALSVDRERDGAVWVSCNTSSDVRVFGPDPATWQASGALHAIAVRGAAMFGAFSGGVFYVPTQGNDRVIALDAVTRAEIFALALPRDRCLNAHALDVMPDGTLAVVCEGDHRKIPGQVVFVDPTARAVVGNVEVGVFADGLALVAGQR